eukprot:gnl/MRDRNA2_/MRDRNA2_29448_c0_seq1.p1 gnl/MRDRNA2_/MRDRNA2_29448_c0~~gnl/MRDRNA2_/MRDRNA2_29448_c0_seq1.p1  ORF type:complete len:304 (-),score=69.52 gnl/MRDRNA2_/MRDRNA2_29448_c0_seq1:221-1132(-)
MEPREVGTETIEDFNTGKFFAFDQKTGATQRCNARGEPIAKFQKDHSGMASGKHRVQSGMTVEVLEKGLEALPKKIGRPAKYVGFACLPRPGLDMNARGKQCAFTLPSYLHPVEPKLGRISTSAVVKMEKKAEKVSTLPSFLQTLETQFTDTLSMNAFIEQDEPGTGEFHKIRSAQDIEAVTARNRQMAMEGTEKLNETTREMLSTKGRFGRQRPPYNPQEIKQKETDRDRIVNPEKWHLQDEKLKADKASVRKRRRERYPEHFAKIDEQERAQEAAQQRPSLLESAAGATMLPGEANASDGE